MDYDFAVLAQNILIPQTETIEHYRSTLAHVLLSVPPKKTSKRRLSRLSQVSTQQIFLISFAKAKTNHHACWVWRIEISLLCIKVQKSGRCAGFLHCSLSLFPHQKCLGRSTGRTYQHILGLIFFFFSNLLCREKLNYLGNIFSVLALAGSWFKLWTNQP